MSAPPKCKRRPARGGGGPLLGGVWTCTTYRNAADTATVATIYIAPEPFGFGFDLTVRSAPPGERLDREFPTYAAARAHADALAHSRGWQIVDETGEVA